MVKQTHFTGYILLYLFLIVFQVINIGRFLVLEPPMDHLDSQIFEIFKEIFMFAPQNLFKALVLYVCIICRIFPRKMREFSKKMVLGCVKSRLTNVLIYGSPIR